MKRFKQTLWDIWNWMATAIGYVFGVTSVIALAVVPITIILGCVWLWIKMFGGM